MIKTFMDCPDRTEYTEKDSEILAGKEFCERYTDVEGWPKSMYCNEILADKSCPRGFVL